MQRQIIKYLAVLFISLLIAGCGNDQSANSQAVNVASKVNAPADAVARVGDEVITYSQLSTMLNSSAMVGLSVPALGTPERNKVLITLLDKAISANLIYLDAKKNGTDRLTSYTGDVQRFEDAILASIYQSKIMIGDIPVSEAEVQAFYNTDSSQGGELTDDLKLAIESKIRKQKLQSLKASLRDRLRENIEIVVKDDVMSPDYDSSRSDADTVAIVAGQRITWSQVKELMQGADRRATLATFYIDNEEERLKRLDQFIDNTIMTKKGREAGLETDPMYMTRTVEYRKTRLINEHRNKLIREWNPSEDVLKTYYVDKMDKITVPESRKLQMVVVKTKAEAEDIKSKIDQGEITMFQAAQQYSIDPNAKRTLGDMGWVSKGTGFAELDKFTFNLEPELLSGPVESPAGWHLVKVLDVNDAQFENFDNPQTRRRTYRAYMQDKFSDYVVGLRKTQFEVAVYDDELNRRFQQEADMIAELSIKSQQQGSITEQRMQDLQKWITPPAQ